MELILTKWIGAGFHYKNIINPLVIGKGEVKAAWSKKSSRI